MLNSGSCPIIQEAEAGRDPDKAAKFQTEALPSQNGEARMTTIRIRGAKTPKQEGMITMTVIIRSPNIPTFYIDVSIFDKGNPESNLKEVRGVLQTFSREFEEALQHPLQFED
jgi:hypothetical protein